MRTSRMVAVMVATILAAAAAVLAAVHLDREAAGRDVPEPPQPSPVTMGEPRRITIATTPVPRLITSSASPVDRLDTLDHMRIRWLTGAIAAALLATVPVAAEAEPSPTATGGHFVRCEFIPTPENPAAKPVRPPSPFALARGTVRVTLQTNHGRIELELNRDNAPCAVHNLVHLSRSRFYDRTQCWRLTNYDRLGVLQCGDIIRAEVGGPGYRFADELTGTETYPRGTVAMGNLGPDTNGSQFFMVWGNAFIQPAYTILGRVTRGLDVLDRIAAGGIIPVTNENDGMPRLPVHIRKAKAPAGH
jgi:peptidyl-prolyl cis-trans isomerase B (cyclophilin B)